MTTSGRIELMAPAGNFESMQAALDNGCDSIYFGVEQLNMRALVSPLKWSRYPKNLRKKLQIYVRF